MIFNDLYTDKKICLLGCGSSLDSQNIDFDSYDIVVGTNRIHRTKYIKYIHILYHNVSNKDSIETIYKNTISQKQFQYIIFCPFISGPITRGYFREQVNKYNITYCIYNKKIARQVAVEKRPLTGIVALHHMLVWEPSSIDIYGFDFYTDTYIEGLYKFRKHDKLHDIEANKKFLLELINKNPKRITWHQ